MDYRPLSNMRFCVCMRHEKSIAATYGFLSGLGASVPDFLPIVLERDHDSPDEFQTKKDFLIQAVKNGSFDALILATKVNDSGSESQLVQLLTEIKTAGIGQKPIIMTHLTKIDDALKSAIDALSLNTVIVENDNLGFPKPTDHKDDIRTGMSRLGPAILNHLQIE